MFLIFFLLLLIFSSSYSINIDDSEINSSLQILPEKNVIVHDNKYYFGIKINLNNGWKTYWKNPGDAGLPIQIKFKNKKNILDYNILYPSPKFYSDHGVRTIGYEKEVVFPIEFTVKDRSERIFANLDIEYLICKEICIPIREKRLIDFDLKKLKKNTKNNLVLDYLDKVPKKNQGFFKIDDIFAEDENTFFMVLDNPMKTEVEVFPFSSESNLSLKSIVLGNKTKIYIESEEVLKNFKNKAEFVISDGKKDEKVLLNLQNLPLEENILKFLILAFVGGFILNLMPCVFPVLSMKVMSMIKLKELHELKVRKNSFLIIMGIIFSFLLLALILIIFKSLGMFVGWGFQFQNIYFLTFLSIIIFLFSLNLLGFFEIILPNRFMNYLGKIERQQSHYGYFFSGMFSTLMATPCSAPFLGTAIGFASLTSNLNIFFIFFFISIGFSIPYFFLIIKPTLLSFLPKPGDWMINFKYFLGILLLLTFFWLLTVIDVNFLINLSLFLSVVFFSIIIKKKSKVFSILIFSLTMCFVFFFLNFEKKENLVWERFDENLIQNYKESNNLVFVDFTADWCVTCKFNKFTALDNKDVIKFFLENDVKLVRGDWTKKDEKILNFLKKYERFGVPVNIIYSKNMKDGLVLPEILTKNNIIENFERIKEK